jgi:hypothetical protein
MLIRYPWNMTKTVSLRLAESLLVEVDALGDNREEFFRRAIEEKIARARANETVLLDIKRRNRTWGELDDAESW